MSKFIDKYFKMIESGSFNAYHYEPNWKKIEKIPEFARLKECKQNPTWHSEGNAWEHTKLVVSEAVKIQSNYLEDECVQAFLLGCLFHDIGKGVTTFEKNGTWHSYNHEIEGEKITRRMLWDEGFRLRETVCALVRWHMEPIHIFEHKNPFGAFIKLCSIFSNRWFVYQCNAHMLFDVKLCDILGSKKSNPNVTEDDLKTIQRLHSVCYEINEYAYREFDCFVTNKLELVEDYVDSINLNILIGLPGAGKDTYIEKMFENGVWDKDNTVVLCRDDLRAELGYCKPGEKVVLTSKQEDHVTEIFNLRLRDAAREGKNIVINNINLKRKYREGYIRFLSDFKPYVTYYYIEADGLDTNKERRKGQISDDVFDNMINGFEWPNPYEYHDMEVICKDRENYYE